MIEILEQGPRLRAEAARKTADLNEAYLMVHNAMALAMDKVSAATDAADLQAISRARAVTLELSRPISSEKIGDCATH